MFDLRRGLVGVIGAMAFAASTSHGADSARFLALGDSYTIGEGVAAAQRWPLQLAAALRADGSGLDAPEIVARTGWTTADLAAAIDARALQPHYALVMLLIGVNNQYRGRDLANYRDEFGTLLRRAIALAGARPSHVVVLSIPDWGATRFGRASGRDRAQIAREIDAYNAANADIAKSLHVHYVDVTSASRNAGESAEQLVGDGLHPSALQYRRWAELALPAARAALAAP